MTLGETLPPQPIIMTSFNPGQRPSLNNQPSMPSHQPHPLAGLPEPHRASLPTSSCHPSPSSGAGPAPAQCDPVELSGERVQLGLRSKVRRGGTGRVVTGEAGCTRDQGAVTLIEESKCHLVHHTFPPAEPRTPLITPEPPPSLNNTPVTPEVTALLPWVCWRMWWQSL